jgi:ABC-type Fe3+ transport system substrate-binding protein
MIKAEATMKSALLCMALAATLGGTASAQNPQEVWKATQAKAKGQVLKIQTQGDKPMDFILEEFTKKTGVKLETTVSRPSNTISRVRTEQTNGQYLWDLWWGITSNMVHVAVPAGLLARIDELLILPEVRDAGNWRHAAYMYGEPGNHVFTYSHEVNVGVFRNKAVAPDVKVDSLDALLDPRLKGRIALREASVPNAGSFALSSLIRAKGPDFVRKLMTAMEPRIYANPQQLDVAIMRGGAAVAIGMQSSAVSECRKAGGCKTIEEVPSVAFIQSRGLSVFRNSPNPEAARVFVNWFLSREGQEVYVREWARNAVSGAVSHRKDVAPHKDHVSDLPDFARADQYVWVSIGQGSKAIDEATRIYKSIAEK